MMLAIEKKVDADPINLGNENPVTIKEIAELILQLTGYKTAITFDTSKPQGVKSRKADMDKSWKTLGWKPKTPIKRRLV